MPDAPKEKPFIFICGQDDFLVGRKGRERYEQIASEITDEFSREIISGFATNAEEVENAITRLHESVQTVPMFGGRRLVWFKDLNFLTDSRTGNSETVNKALEHLQSLLAAINPAEVTVLITATPVDGRKKFYKWCEQTADFAFVGVTDKKHAAEMLTAAALDEARALGVKIEHDALELLVARCGTDTRFLIGEVHKLAIYADPARTITDAMVEELTPNIDEGDFFEGVEYFFRGDLSATLAAFERHFFIGESARPLLSALQNRNRLLIQIRSLAPQGDRRVGKQQLDQAQARHAVHFTGASRKTASNLFSQKPVYVNRLATGAKPWPLRRHIDLQFALADAFTELLDRGEKEGPAILRELALKFLS